MKRWQKHALGCSATLGNALVILGLLAFAVLHLIGPYLGNLEVELTPDNLVLEERSRTSFHVFNFTNRGEAIAAAGSKPRLVEVGPFVYEEVRRKVDVRWLENGTVTYRLLRSLSFDPSASRGDPGQVLLTVADGGGQLLASQVIPDQTDLGVFNVHTGVAKKTYPQMVNEIHTWNYLLQGGGSAGNGGALGPLVAHRGSRTVALFSSVLRRTLVLERAEEETVDGVRGVRFRLPDTFLNASCHHRSSMTTTTTATLVSQPHFYQADPCFASFLAEGSLSPDSSEHETALVLHPSSGATLKATVRFQVNRAVTIAETAGFLPSFWFETETVLPATKVRNLRLTTRLDNVTTFAIVGGIGVLCFIICCVVTFLAAECEYRRDAQGAQGEGGATRPAEPERGEPIDDEADAIDPELRSASTSETEFDPTLNLEDDDNDFDNELLEDPDHIGVLEASHDDEADDDDDVDDDVDVDEVHQPIFFTVRPRTTP